MSGKKNDHGKPRMELLSNIALRGTATVLTMGASHYSSDNWRDGLAWRRLIGACARHLFAFSDGEDLDLDSGLPHLDHLAAEVMFLQEAFRTRPEFDDRYIVKLPKRKRAR